MEVNVVLNGWSVMEHVMSETIFQSAIIMMVGIVDHQTSNNGQSVLTILNSLEMEYVLIILKPNLNAIMMLQIVVQIMNQLEMGNAIQKI